MFLECLANAVTLPHGCIIVRMFCVSWDATTVFQNIEMIQIIEGNGFDKDTFHQYVLLWGEPKTKNPQMKVFEENYQCLAIKFTDSINLYRYTVQHNICLMYL